MTKGKMMAMVFSKKELQSIDSAVPVILWDRINTAVHVMNYNEPNRHGILVNLETESCNRGVNLKENEE